jgi:RecB family exonuclease
MVSQPITLLPEDVAILVECPLHYHFQRQQTNPTPGDDLEPVVRQIIHQLHAAGGPYRVSLRRCLAPLQHQPVAQRLVERYYTRLRQEWTGVIASNETLELKITIAGVGLRLEATPDRLSQADDGGISVVLIHTGSSPLPPATELRRNPANTIYHALVATAYPLKRPVRIQELWLQHDQAVTIELTEEEYRHNLSRLREPVRDLARGQVQARPGHHCDRCPFKSQGCPVYAHDESDFETHRSDGTITNREWVYNI